VIGPEPVAVKPDTLPLVTEAVQVKVVPGIPEVGVYATFELLQRDSVLPLVNVGTGLTVIVKVIGVPLQTTPPDKLVYEGVTVTVAITGKMPVLFAAKVGIFPAPLAASPMPGVSFVQL